MKRFNSQSEQIVFNLFRQALSNTKLELRTQDRWKTTLMIRRFDLVIYKDTNPLAVVEVKGGIQDKNRLAIATDQVRSALSIIKARYGIVTDGDVFYLYDRNMKEADYQPIDFGTLIAALTRPSNIAVRKADKEEIASIIRMAHELYLSDNQKLGKLINTQSLYNKIEFSQTANQYYFKDNQEGLKSFENQFFSSMFGEFKDKKICRYTSLSTVFSMLNYMSFRMSEIAGMNDKSEVNYVDSYLNGVERPITKEHHHTITAINNRYISSCTSYYNKDNLTLWRLYAEDSQGVCLVFDTKLRNLNNHLLIQRVKYADQDGSHKELDFLKYIKEEVESLTGFPFEFRKLGFWKHFFKPYEYSIEEEVRLLVIDNDSLIKRKSDWVMTYSHSIINPIIDFGLNSKAFPIYLSEIILGPKCPEIEINKVQLEEMLRRKKKEVDEMKVDANIKGIKVNMSEIKHYR